MAINGTAEVLTRVQALLRTNSDQYATAQELQSNFRIASDQLLNMLIGPIYQYKDQRPSATFSSQTTSDIDNLLSPFRETVDYIYTQDQIWYPNEAPFTAVGRQIFKYEDWQAFGYSIHFPPQNQLMLYLNSQINFPTKTEPYGQDVGNGKIRVWPMPEEVKALVIAGDEDIKVSFLPNSQNINPAPAATTPTNWPQRAYDSLVYLVLGMFGIQIMAPPLINVAQQQRAQSL
jgi:hypothetical protein